MLLGYNTNGLVHHRLDEALRLMADLGYRAVALTLDHGHLDPLRADPAEVAATAALCRRLGLTVVVETGARFVLDPRRKHRPNLLEADEAERTVRLDFLRRCHRIAAELGATALSLWSGSLPEGVRPDEARGRLRQGLETLCDDAGRLGVPLAFEPEPGMLIETVAEAEALAAELGDPRDLGLTVDVGHLLVTGEGEPAEVLPRVAGRIRQIHVEDVRRGVHEHLPPGEGDLDFPALWGCLRQLDYRGPVCWELSRSAWAGYDMLIRARACFGMRQAHEA